MKECGTFIYYSLKYFLGEKGTEDEAEFFTEPGGNDIRNELIGLTIANTLSCIDHLPVLSFSFILSVCCKQADTEKISNSGVNALSTVS